MYLTETEYSLSRPKFETFQTLKNNLKDASLRNVDPEGEFVVETDASDFCIAATLNQEGSLKLWNQMKLITTQSKKKLLKSLNQFVSGGTY